jgi:hypothetical protein
MHPHTSRATYNFVATLWGERGYLLCGTQTYSRITRFGTLALMQLEYPARGEFFCKSLLGERTVSR